MQINNISCCITVDDKPLDEYHPELSDDGKTCSAWIPCQAGQEFSIRWTDTDRQRTTSTDVIIDGLPCGKCQCVLRSPRTWDDFTRSYVRVSPTETRSMQFGVLELTDDELYANNDKDRRIAEITISVWLGRVTGSEPCRGGIQVPESSRVHEKTKKGLAHSVKFGAVQRRKSGDRCIVKRLEDKPLATFIFRYRSLDILRANGIVMQPGSNTATVSQLSGSASRLGDLSPAVGKRRKASEDLGAERPPRREMVDIEEIERDREAVRQAEEALRKARLRLYRQEGNKRVKLEDVSAFISGEVVDLTEE